MMKDKGSRACEQRQYEATAAELPLCCPPQDSRVWDTHPRVYLPIAASGHEVCPYCGAEYRLKDFQRDNNS
ncbi:MAG: zinc-finger domain-containing protein [Gammaproteobacteria bacterium]|nr:zinc-finger domain-containing protein [Gammaproteobacteria bacterium]